ncbi:MAG: hypothetical protein P3W93_000695 [Thermus sp.]|nr:hypothetical protein [Thermus sp.]
MGAMEAQEVRRLAEEILRLAEERDWLALLEEGLLRFVEPRPHSHERP